MKIMRRAALCLLVVLMTVAAMPLTGVAAIGEGFGTDSEPVFVEETVKREQSVCFFG